MTYLVQFGGARFHPGPVNPLAPLALIGFVVVVGAVGVPMLGFAVSAGRRALGCRRDRRRRLRDAANAERRTRAIMGELCPHGWQAQITVIADTGDGRPSGHAPVALDWAELTDDDGRPAVTRRVWAPTIGEALDAMVADRRTDETLEQIEHRAVADGITWPDV
ncbi:MAG: hypothetical protein WAL63_18730 [Solirubrobacteraceae bacterium]